MPNKIKFTTESYNGALSKGNARISTGGSVGPTHLTGFYNGITPPVNGYTFYVQKGETIVESGLTLYLDAGNYTSYNPVLSGDTWYDLSGNGYDFNNYGADYNSNFSFNGSTDYMKTTEVLVSSPSELTIGGWIMKKNVGVGTYECALHQSSAASIGGSRYWFGLNNGTNAICATIGADSVGWDAGLTTTVPLYDDWYYVVATWNGSIVYVYINGSYNKQYNLASYSNITTPTRIGAADDGTTYQFGGEIGQVFIYNKYLTGSEVTQNFNATKERYGL